MDFYGVWLSMVERFVRDEEAAGSNPVTPIKQISQLRLRNLFFYFHVIYYPGRKSGDIIGMIDYFITHGRVLLCIT